MYRENLKAFFQNHQKEIETNYPGIKLSLLNEEMDYFVYVRNKNYSEFIGNLREGIPLEYQNERAHFYGHDYFVNSNVLIPRFETELLAELALSEIDKSEKEILKVLDLGTGSGILATTLAIESNKKLELVASDISKEALSVAKQNIFFHEFLFKKDHRIELVQSDKFKGIDSKFDMIVSNPPYIKKDGDKHLVHKNANKFEPEKALYLADLEYESWFRDFFMSSYKSLDGALLMEGHEEHLEDLKKIAEDVGFVNGEILNDLTGRKRILKAWTN